MITRLFSTLRKLKFRKTRIDLNFMDLKFIASDFGFSRGKPIDRHYIEGFIRIHSEHICGSVLEFGEDYYFRKFGSRHNSKCDIFTSELEYKKGDNKIFGDLTKVNPGDFGQYDCIICTNVLNFIFDIDSAIKGLSILLKPDGICILTLAGFSTHISQYDHDRWGDYWRFSDKSAELLLRNEFEIIGKNLYGNQLAASAQINGYSFEDLDSEKANFYSKEYLMTIGLLLRKRSK